MAVARIEQDVLAIPLITKLNEARGVISADFLRVPPETRTNLPMLAGKIGIALSAERPIGPYEDEPLGAFWRDFEASDPEALDYGLIIKEGNPLYKNATNKRVVLMPTLPLSILNQGGGVQLPTVGVAVGRGEFPIIQTSPRALADRARASTLDARERENAGSREERDQAALRAAGHALEAKLDKLNKLETQFLGQRALLLSLQKDARLVWRTAYLGKNLNRKRVEADEFLHEMVEIAANNLNYGTVNTSAAHRALTSRLYRRGSAQELATSWLSMTEWARHYLNAKRGKVNQAINGSEAALRPYKASLDRGRARSGL